MIKFKRTICTLMILIFTMSTVSFSEAKFGVTVTYCNTGKAKYLKVKNNIPAADLDVLQNTKILVIYPEMNIWDWKEKDINQMESLSNEEALSQIETLSNYLKVLEQKRIQLNGFNLYPQMLTLKMDVIETAIFNRKDKLGISHDTYTSVTKEAFESINENSRGELIATKEKAKDCIAEDKKVYISISKYKNNPLPGLSLVFLPYKNNAIGFTSASKYVVYLSSIGFSWPVSITAFHEIGHVWGEKYLNLNYEKYASIKGVQFDENDYESCFRNSECFASDFAFVENPDSSIVGYQNYYGTQMSNNKYPLLKTMISETESFSQKPNYSIQENSFFQN